MGVPSGLERLVDKRVEKLIIQCNNSDELGLISPIVSVEIIGLELVAKGLHLVRAVIDGGVNR